MSLSLDKLLEDWSYRSSFWDSDDSETVLSFIWYGTSDVDSWYQWWLFGTRDGGSCTSIGYSGTSDGWTKVPVMVIGTSDGYIGTSDGYFFRRNLPCYHAPVQTCRADGCAYGHVRILSGVWIRTRLHCMKLGGCGFVCDFWPSKCKILRLKRSWMLLSLLPVMEY